MKNKTENLGKVSITVEKEFWNIDKAYDRLTIVERQGTRSAYISRKAVPVGVSIEDRNYWITISKWADVPYEIVQEFGNDPDVGISQKVLTKLRDDLQRQIDESIRPVVDPVPTRNSPNSVSSGGVFDAMQTQDAITASFSEDGKIYYNFKAGDIFYVEQDGVHKYRVAYVDGTADEEHPITIDGLRFYFANNASDAIFNSILIRNVSTVQQQLTPIQKSTARENIAAVTYEKQELTSAQQVQLQNNMMGKEYAPADFSSLGKKVFAKNVQAVGGVDKNIMTQTFFEDEQGNPLTNTVFIIQYDYELGEDITIPENCVLQFEGGSINEGKITLSSNNTILGNNNKCQNLTYVLNGSNIIIDSVVLQGTIDDTLENLTYGIVEERSGDKRFLTIKHCTILHYNNGIWLWNFQDVNIIENLIYDIGSVTASDNEVDIEIYGDSTNTHTNVNIIRNKCLSKNVHRNICLGLVSSEDNILIDGNICVSCNNNFTEDASRNYNKAHCIMVGYDGTKSSNKHCKIVNNVCKHSGWGGLYLRSKNVAPDYGDNGYQFVVSNNYIENIRPHEGETPRGGIYIEVRCGSIVSNNEIVDCYNGIHIGALTNNSCVLVDANTVKNCDYGILNEQTCLEYTVSNNYITNCGLGIKAIQYRPDGVEKNNSGFCHIVNNTIKLPVENRASLSSTEGGGILIYNLLTDSVLCSTNQITGRDKENNMFGISIQRGSDIGYSITNNIVCLCSMGLYINNVATNVAKDNIKCNRFISCKFATGLSSGTTASKNNNLIFEDCRYDDCDAICKDFTYYLCIFDGRVDNNDNIEIYQSNKIPIPRTVDNIYFNDCPICCITEKSFRPGDRIIYGSFSTGIYQKLYFSSAVCVSAKSEESIIGKWFLTNGMLSTAIMNKSWFKVKGQTVLNLDDNKMYYYDGTAWVDVTGTQV